MAKSRRLSILLKNRGDAKRSKPKTDMGRKIKRDRIAKANASIGKVLSDLKKRKKRKK